MNSNQTETSALQTIDRSTDLAEPARTSASALMMDVKTMESLMRVADLMASGKSTVPAHLQKNPADCMAVVMQSMQWGMNPFAVAQKTHIVNGALGYEAQLVNAVIQASGSIEGRFHYEHRGNAGSVECRVGATIRGEADMTWGEWLNESKVTTKNSPLWKTNPKQQLGYLQVKNWARLYCPGAILGVYTPDEFDAPVNRDMGPAVEVVQELTYIDVDAMIAKALETKTDEEAATFWRDHNAKLAKQPTDHASLKSAIIGHRRTMAEARTVDMNAPTSTPAASATGPVVTFESILKKLNEANSLDALYVAGDWIGEVADPDQRAELSARFDELQTKFGG